MNPTGGSDLLVAARSVLLDALAALHTQRRSVVVIGAQAVYLRAGSAAVGLAEATKDSDLALDPRTLPDEPLLDDIMIAAGFRHDGSAAQPGSWIGEKGIPVDLMVPEALAGSGGRRGARIPPHSKHAARRAVGLEATLVDRSPLLITALDDTDSRAIVADVAGPAALIVAKLHKLGERQDTIDRLVDKDAHDLYRLLVATSTGDLARTFARLLVDPLADEVTDRGLALLQQLFARGPSALGSVMAGRAEEGISDPVTVATSVSLLAGDLLDAVRS